MLAVLHLSKKCTDLRGVFDFTPNADFTPDAFSPFDYSKRAFNDFPLRDSFTFGSLSDEMGKWNGHIFVFRFFWKPDRI